MQSGTGYSHANASAVVSVKDDDPGLQVSPNSLRVGKGGSIPYSIVLATPPVGRRDGAHQCC